MSSKKLRTGNRKELSKAFFQFCLDHGEQRGDSVIVRFEITNYGDLMRRVKARENGLYRYTKDDLLNIRERKQDKIMQELLIMRKLARKNSEKVNQIQKGNNRFKKILLKIHWYLRDYLFR